MIIIDLCFFVKKGNIKYGNWKHLSLDQRKVISSGISHNYRLKNIAESIGFDPTSIHKEVKRNIIDYYQGLTTSCKKLNR